MKRDPKWDVRDNKALLVEVDGLNALFFWMGLIAPVASQDKSVLDDRPSLVRAVLAYLERSTEIPKPRARVENPGGGLTALEPHHADDERWSSLRLDRTDLTTSEDVTVVLDHRVGSWSGIIEIHLASGRVIPDALPKTTIEQLISAGLPAPTHPPVG